jgi:hypothetical protein
MALAKHLACFGIFEFPGPVLGLVDLTSSIRVATQTGPRDIRTGLEILFQLLKRTMIRSRLPEILLFFRDKWRGSKQYEGHKCPQECRTGYLCHFHNTLGSWLEPRASNLMLTRGILFTLFC